jgi:hypothetical protein
MHMTGLYERSQAFSAPDDEARAASAEFAYCELLLSGVTSLADISAAWDGWIDLFAKSAMRAFLARDTPRRAGGSATISVCSSPATRRADGGASAALALIDPAAQHPTGGLSAAGLLRQSVFGRLAGYEDRKRCRAAVLRSGDALGGWRPDDCRVCSFALPDGPVQDEVVISA